MYNGNQVLRFDNKYKAADLGGLSVELTSRKGSGNYDKARTKFNIEYTSIEGNLASTVYKNLSKNNVIYGENKKNINMLNGAIVTSGNEFFQNLGMNFIDSGRTYQVGENIGMPILIPDIKNNDDIPEKVKEYFNESYEFLSNYVGKENVVYASVHLDEDTPHMHFYFTPVVTEVKRKVFETDENNNVIKKEITDKKGNLKYVPIQKKDINGNNMYSIDTGIFLNSDQFWKNKGGKTSFAKVQDEYNEYINNKGFNLYRGDIGSNKQHIDKQTHNYKNIKLKVDSLENEYENLVNKNKLEIETSKELINVDNNLNITKKKMIGYKNSEVEELIDYSKSITKENIININEVNKLTNELKHLKSTTALSEKNELINHQNIIIDKQDKIINSLRNEILSLKDRLEYITEKFKEKLNKAYKAISKLLGNKNENFNFEETEIFVTKITKNNKDKEYEL